MTGRIPHMTGEGAAPPLSTDRPSPDREQREFIALISAQVRDAFLRKPHFVDAGTDLVTVCRQLAQNGIADALVTEGERLGIFTTTRLRDALLLDQPPGSIRVGDFTTFDPYSVSAGDSLHDAMNLMLRHRVHRVLVREGGQVVGILSQLDLMGFLANHSHLILSDVERAGDVPALARAAQEVEGLIRGLNDDGVRTPIIARLVGRLNRRIFARLWDMLAPPEIRANSCLIVMGSEGRSEQVVRTDQDNALILRDGFDHPRLAEVTQAFTDALISFGYPPCPGGIMLSRPLWRQPLRGFCEALRKWAHGGDPDGPMNLAIFLDADVVAGDAGLLAQARAYLRRIVGDSDVFHARFALAIRQFGEGGGWWRRLPGLRGPEAAEIDVKKLGIFPLVHGARALSLQYGIEALGTDDRLRALADAGRLAPDQARDLADALHRLMALKLAANLAQLSAGATPDNTIRLGSLSKLERQSLRDALAIVREFRGWIAHHYRLDML